MSDMTREEAKRNLEDLREYKIVLSDIPFNDQEKICDLAISALTEELSEDGTLTVHVKDGSKVKRVFVMGDNIYGGLYYPDSAKTDKAKPDEGAELIDRRQIKWYGCDHEGRIKGINCETADCSKCDRDIAEVSTPYCPYCGAKMTWVGAKDILHKAIDNTTFAEEVYPNIKEELHKAVDMAESENHEEEEKRKIDFLEFLVNNINPNEMEKYREMYESGGEKTDEA